MCKENVTICPLNNFFSFSVSFLHRGFRQSLEHSNKSDYPSFKEKLPIGIFFRSMLRQKMMKSKNYRPLESVKNVRITAQKIHESAVKEIKEVFPNAKLSTAYGSTELDGITRSLGGLKGNSSGQVVFNYSVKVRKTEFLNLLQNIFSQ